MTQRDPDLLSELEELKARVRALAEAQERGAELAAAEAASPGAASAETVAQPAATSAGAPALDFDELMDVLKHEVEDLHPLTCLAIFGLGVLTGRLLAH